MDYAEAFLEQNQAFGDVVRGADPATPVPTCPGWTFRELFRHVGHGNRWAAQMVAARADQELDHGAVDGSHPPSDPDDATRWLYDSAQRLIDAVEQAGPETPVWTFIGARPAHWWVRRRLHETVVHRADAELALGLDCTLAPELAGDAIGEWLERVAAQAGGNDLALPLEDGNTVHLHATDAGLGAAGEWTISADAGQIKWAYGHSKATVALRGAATDLLLALTRRVPVADTGIVLFGDAAMWQRWLDHTRF